jgi:hypothetical protein
MSQETDVQKLADQQQCAELSSRYAIGLDQGRRELFAAAWAPHATFTCDELGLACRDREEILAWFDRVTGKAAAWPAVGGQLRLASNLLVEVDGDSARGDAEYIAYRFDGTALHPYSAGRYEDRYERFDGRWAFTARTMVVTPVLPTP